MGTTTLFLRKRRIITNNWTLSVYHVRTYINNFFSLVIPVSVWEGVRNGGCSLLSGCAAASSIYSSTVK